jgi:molecular chaperone DnaK (HSP70)
MPFTAKADPATTELSRATDALNPRGPITAVFAPVDLNDDPNLSPLPSADTEELEPHDARPVHPQNSTAVPAQSPTNSKGASKTGELAPNDEGLQSSPGDGRSRKSLFILAVVIALVIGGLLVGYTFSRQQAQARAAKQQAQIKIENQNQKDGQIAGLRNKIHELSNRLQASHKPSLEKKRRDISESLDRLIQRLDEVTKISPDQLSEISQACDEIRKELDKIEDEVNSLHGLLPTLDTDRDPIKV